MKLWPTQINKRNNFTAYGNGYVSVNTIRHTRNLIVLPNHIVTDWTEASFDTLSITEFKQLAVLDAEIIILGTGNQLRFPPPELMQPLIQSHKGLEVMDIQAACRTYNVLIGESRKIAACLLFN